MAANKILNVPPIALTVTLTTNLFNIGVTSMTGPVGVTVGQPYAIIRHMRAANKTAGAVTISLWKGATGANAAGTEFAWNTVSIPANSYIDWYGVARFDSGDFLVGGSNTATAVTLALEGEIGISG